MTQLQQQFLKTGLATPAQVKKVSAQMGRAKAVSRLETQVSEALKSAQTSGKKADWAKYAQLRQRLPRGLRAAH